MSVVTSVEDSGPCRKRLTIEVPAEAVEAEIGRVVANLRQGLHLPGFRKGKVPISLVRKRFQEDIEREVVDRLLPRYWHQAQAEKDLDPLLPPEVSDLQLEAGKPMTVIAEVETRPQIDIGELEDFDLPDEPTEPSEQEVDDAIRDLRSNHATWKPVERSAARGDLVIARSVQLDDDGEPQSEPEPVQLEVGAESTGEETSLALTGVSAGQTIEIQPSDDGERPVRRRLEIEEVREAELPELDDQLISKFGEFESVDAFRQALAADMEQHKRRALDQRREEALTAQLRERYPLELPERVIERQTESMLNDYAGQLQAGGIDLEKAEIDWEKLAAQVRPQAQLRVHDRLLLDAIAKARDVRLDEAEFERFLATLAAQQRTSSLALRQKLSESGRLEPLRAQMLRRQTVRMLLGDEPAAPDDEPAGPEADEPRTEQ